VLIPVKNKTDNNTLLQFVSAGLNEWPVSYVTN